MLLFFLVLGGGGGGGGGFGVVSTVVAVGAATAGFAIAAVVGIMVVTVGAVVAAAGAVAFASADVFKNNTYVAVCRCSLLLHSYEYQEGVQLVAFINSLVVATVDGVTSLPKHVPAGS